VSRRQHFQQACLFARARAGQLSVQSSTSVPVAGRIAPAPGFLVDSASFAWARARTRWQGTPVITDLQNRTEFRKENPTDSASESANAIQGVSGIVAIAGRNAGACENPNSRSGEAYRATPGCGASSPISTFLFSKLSYTLKRFPGKPFFLAVRSPVH